MTGNYPHPTSEVGRNGKREMIYGRNPKNDPDRYWFDNRPPGSTYSRIGPAMLDTQIDWPTFDPADHPNLIVFGVEWMRCYGDSDHLYLSGGKNHQARLYAKFMPRMDWEEEHDPARLWFFWLEGVYAYGPSLPSVLIAYLDKLEYGKGSLKRLMRKQLGLSSNNNA